MCVCRVLLSWPPFPGYDSMIPAVFCVLFLPMCVRAAVCSCRSAQPCCSQFSSSFSCCNKLKDSHRNRQMDAPSHNSSRLHSMPAWQQQTPRLKQAAQVLHRQRQQRTQRQQQTHRQQHTKKKQRQGTPPPLAAAAAGPRSRHLLRQHHQLMPLHPPLHHPAGLLPLPQRFCLRPSAPAAHSRRGCDLHTQHLQRPLGRLALTP